MNLQAILTLTMEQSGLDVDDLSEYKTRLVQYVNDGYMRIMLEKYQPWTEETAQCANESIAFGSLSRTPLKIMLIMQNDVEFVGVLRDDQRLIEASGLKDGECTIRYQYKPQRLAFDADEPKLPEWAHGALADWATWKLLSGGNQSKQMRAQSFRLTFEETFRNLKPYISDVSYRKQFVNLYN